MIVRLRSTPPPCFCGFTPLSSEQAGNLCAVLWMQARVLLVAASFGCREYFLIRTPQAATLWASRVCVCVCVCVCVHSWSVHTVFGPAQVVVRVCHLCCMCVCAVCVCVGGGLTACKIVLWASLLYAQLPHAAVGHADATGMS